MNDIEFTYKDTEKGIRMALIYDGQESFCFASKGCISDCIKPWEKTGNDESVMFVSVCSALNKYATNPIKKSIAISSKIDRRKRANFCNDMALFYAHELVNGNIEDEFNILGGGD